MAPGRTQGTMHWSSFTGNALKVAELLVKLWFIEEEGNSIVGDVLDSGEELKHLNDDMCKSFFQNYCKPGADQKGVVIFTMAKIFLKLVWEIQHMKRVSRTIDIDTITIE